MVEQIKEFRSELQVHLLVDGKLFHQRHVPSLVSRAFNNISSGISKGSCDQVVREGASVKQRARNARMGIWITYKIRPGAVKPNRAATISVGYRLDIRRSVIVPSRRGNHARHLPISDDLIQETGCVSKKVPAAAERQLIYITENETVANVKVGVAVILIGKSLILEVSVVDRAQAGAGRVVERMRKSVGSFKLKTVREPFLQTRLQEL